MKLTFGMRVKLIAEKRGTTGRIVGVYRNNDRRREDGLAPSYLVLLDVEHGHDADFLPHNSGWYMDQPFLTTIGGQNLRNFEENEEFLEDCAHFKAMCEAASQDRILWALLKQMSREKSFFFIADSDNIEMLRIAVEQDRAIDHAMDLLDPRANLQMPEDIFPVVRPQEAAARDVWVELGRRVGAMGAVGAAHAERPPPIPGELPLGELLREAAIPFQRHQPAPKVLPKIIKPKVRREE